MAGKPEFQQRLEAIEELIGRIEGAADPAVQAAARELVELVMSLHGAALERILEMLRAGGEPAQHWIDSFGRDELVSSLLVLYGLHPLSLEVRVEQAIERIRPSLRKRGGEVEILAIEDGVPKLKLYAKGHAAALKEMVEGAVYQSAPDVTSLLIEGPEDGSGFVPLEALSGPAGSRGLNSRARTDVGKGSL